jgi:hypothetical protein
LITALAGDKFEIWRRGGLLMHASKLSVLVCADSSKPGNVARRDMDGRANVDDTIDGNPKTKGLSSL